MSNTYKMNLDAYEVEKVDNDGDLIITPTEDDGVATILSHTEAKELHTFLGDLV